MRLPLGRRRERVRMYPRDVCGQATLEALGRPWRTLLTVLGTVLGVGMFVATLGITNSGRAQVNQRFNVLLSTEVDVQDAHPDDGVFALTSAGEAGAARLHGVRAAGLLGKVKSSPEISALPLPTNELASSAGDRPELYYADLGGLRVIRPVLARGRLFDRTQLQRAGRGALLGANAARSLGIEATE